MMSAAPGFLTLESLYPLVKFDLAFAGNSGYVFSEQDTLATTDTNLGAIGGLFSQPATTKNQVEFLIENLLASTTPSPTDEAGVGFYTADLTTVFLVYFKDGSVFGAGTDVEVFTSFVSPIIEGSKATLLVDHATGKVWLLVDGVSVYGNPTVGTNPIARFDVAVGGACDLIAISASNASIGNIVSLGPKRQTNLLSSAGFQSWALRADKSELVQFPNGYFKPNPGFQTSTNATLSEANRVATSTVEPDNAGMPQATATGYPKSANTKNHLDVLLLNENVLANGSTRVGSFTITTLSDTRSLTFTYVGNQIQLSQVAMPRISGANYNELINTPFVEGDFVSFLVDHGNRTYRFLLNDVFLAEGTIDGTETLSFVLIVVFVGGVGTAVRALTNSYIFAAEPEYSTWEERALL